MCVPLVANGTNVSVNENMRGAFDLSGISFHIYYRKACLHECLTPSLPIHANCIVSLFEFQIRVTHRLGISYPNRVVNISIDIAAVDCSLKNLSRVRKANTNLSTIRILSNCAKARCLHGESPVEKLCLDRITS